MGSHPSRPLIKSEFKWSSSADQTIRNVDLTGKIAFVTGANTGIGIETARVLAQHGATVIIGCRDPKKADDALAKISATNPKGTVEAMRLDLGSLASVRECAREFKTKYNKLNILVNNAGIMTPPERTLTSDGFEIQFGVNHLGHFLLFNLLEEELLRGAPSRVTYGTWGAYGQSKTANILFAVEVTKRYKERGITSNALHPGAVKTELQRHSKAGVMLANVAYCLNLFKSPAQGAATSVYLATAPELEGIGGKFFSDSNEVTCKPYATDSEAAAKLWEISAKLVGLNN